MCFDFLSSRAHCTHICTKKSSIGTHLIFRVFCKEVECTYCETEFAGVCEFPDVGPQCHEVVACDVSRSFAYFFAYVVDFLSVHA